ncbi:MAG: TrkH family potassium uptake protein [Burkholderiales bacterium]
MVRIASILNILGKIIAIFAATMLLPLALSLLLDDGAATAYDEAIAATLACGGGLWLATRKRSRRELKPRDGFLLVTLVWTALPIFAMLPLLLHVPELSITDAYFEAMSGLTASGGTVLSNLDSLPASLNLWRGLIVWLGGMGVIVLAVAILPMLGVGGAQLFKAETPGPIKDAKLTPRITETAKWLWVIYFGLSAACFLAMRLAGLGWIDAAMHTFTTMGLGGFSNRDGSIGHFDSVAVESVTVVFMLIAVLNFAMHFRALRSRSLMPYLRDPETRACLGVLAGSTVLVTIHLFVTGTYSDLGTAFRYATFNVVSVATTTGYATTDYSLWPVFAPIWMLFLCTFVSSSGSTGGGFKMIRALVLWQQTFRELRRLVHPRAVIHVKIGQQVIENNVIFAVLAFAMLFGSTIVIATLLLTISGADIITAFSAALACVTNMGPGLGEVGPASTYAVLTDFQTWVCTIAMLLGRLELFTMFVVMTPSFWRQ